MCSLGFDGTYRRAAEIDLKNVMEDHAPAWGNMETREDGSDS